MGVLSESLPMTHTTLDDSFEHEEPVDIEHAWIERTLLGPTRVRSLPFTTATPPRSTGSATARWVIRM